MKTIIISTQLKTNKQITMIVLSFLSNQIKRLLIQKITCCSRKVSMVKSSKLLQAILETHSLRPVITSDSNRLYKNKITYKIGSFRNKSMSLRKNNNKLRVLSKQHRGKFRKREDYMLHGLATRRKDQCSTQINPVSQARLMQIIIVLLYSKVYLRLRHQTTVVVKLIFKSKTLWTAITQMFKYPKNIYRHAKCSKRTTNLDLDNLAKIIKALNVFWKLSVLLDHEIIARMGS